MVPTPATAKQTYQAVMHLDQMLELLEQKIDRVNAVNVKQGMRIDQLSRDLLEAREENRQLRQRLAGGGA